jgi:hypothetical protein
VWGTRAYWPGGLHRVSATRRQAIFSCGVVLKGRSPASASPNARNILPRHVQMLEFFLCCQCLQLAITSNDLLFNISCDPKVGNDKCVLACSFLIGTRSVII